MRRLLSVLAMLVISLGSLSAAAPMTTLTISVRSPANKPVDNASVIVRFVRGHSITKLGKGIRREWEMRTNQDGTVKIPPIPQGQILIQVIAKNYQTFGNTFDIDEDQKTVEIKLNAPQPQYSAH